MIHFDTHEEEDKPMSENRTSHRISPENNRNAMPLPMLSPGQPACVTSVMAAGHGCVRKLGSMGIMPGSRVTVLNSQAGPMLLKVGESRYAIGRGMAQRILVVPCK